MKILIADGDAVRVRVLFSYLGSPGYKVLPIPTLSEPSVLAAGGGK